MVSALYSASSSLISSPGRGHCVVFLGKTCNLTVPLSTQVYKWVLANMMLGGNHWMDWHPIYRGVELLLVAVCFRNWNKLWPDVPFTCSLHVCADLILPFYHNMSTGKLEL